MLLHDKIINILNSRKLMNKLTKILLLLFPIYWIYFIGFQYFTNYPGKLLNILNFSNLEFVFVSIIINFLVLKYNPFKIFTKNKTFQPETNGLIIAFLISISCLIAFLITGFKQEIISQNTLIYSTTAFLKSFLYTVLSTITVIFSTFTLGDLLLSKLFTKQNPLKYYLYSTAVGTISIVYLMFLIGNFGYLNKILVTGILILPIALNFKTSWKLFKTITIKKINLKNRFDNSYLLLLAAFLTLFSYVFLNLFKAFPVGWDSSSLYINISNLITQNQSLISGFEAYNWSIFTSIGLIVFENFPTTLFLSFLGGIWSLLMLFDISKRFLNEKQSLVLSFIIFTLPSFIFLSIIDQKTDLGFLFFGLTAVSLILDFINFKNKIKFLLFAGLISGFLFGIKYTALFIIIGLASVIFYSSLGLVGGIITLCLSLIFLFSFPILEIRALEFSQYFKTSIIATSILSLIISSVFLIKKKIGKELIFELLKNLSVFGFAIVIAFSPWIFYNYSTSKSTSINGILYGKSNVPNIDTNKINKEIVSKEDQLKQVNINPEVKTDTNISNQNTGVKEELGRYAGYEKDSFKLLSIFYDVNIGTNVKGPIVDIGIVLLTLLPLTGFLVLFLNLKERKKNVIISFLSLMFLAYLNISFLTAKGFSVCDQNIISCTLEKVNSIGVDINNIFTLSVFSYIFLPLFWFLTLISNYIDPVFAIFSTIVINFGLVFPIYLTEDKKVKALSIFLFSTLALWTILGFGIYWYSIVSFVLLFLAVFLNIEKINDKKYFLINGVFNLNIIKYFLVFWIIISFFSVFYVKSGTHLLESSFVKYITQSKSQIDTLELLNAAYKTGVEAVNKSQDSKVYKVGSFLQFFITNNNKRVLQDNQLDIFNSINLNINNKEAIAKALKDQGFEFIIYDLNTASIDKTSLKTLTKKVEKFENFLKDNNQLELISTDRRYADENGTNEVTSNGKVIKYSNKVFGNQKELLRPGSVAVYKIK